MRNSECGIPNPDGRRRCMDKRRGFGRSEFRIPNSAFRIAPMVYISRIYTKAGDRGDTGLGDGTRVPKDHPRVEAIGQVDELNAVLGLLHAYCPDAPERGLLRDVQNDLFDVGADLCVPGGEGPRVTAAQAGRLEQAIDRVNDGLTPLTSFVLPGGTPAAAWLHLARTVCRRAERAAV